MIRTPQPVSIPDISTTRTQGGLEVFLTQVKELIERGAGQRGAHYDYYVTQRQLGNLGVDLRGLADNTAKQDFTSISPYPAPGPPTDMAVANSIYANTITWTDPSALGLNNIEVWRSTSDDRTTATRVGIVPDGVQRYIDSAIVSGTTYYYWTRAVVLGDKFSVYAPGESTGTEIVPAAAATINDMLDELFSGTDYANEIRFISDAFKVILPATDVPTWSGATTYDKYQVVFYSGAYYSSLQDSNLNQQPDTETAYWEGFASAALDQAEPVFMVGSVNGTAKVGVRGDLIVDGTIYGQAINSATKITAGSGNDVAVLDGADGTYRIYAGHATPGSAPVQIKKNGDFLFGDPTKVGDYIEWASSTLTIQGGITVDQIALTNSGYIRGGMTDYATGTGFWMGYSGGTYKLSIGAAGGDMLTWDGSNLAIGSGATIAGTAITSIQNGATAGATWGSNIASQPTQLSNINASEGSKLSGIATGATANSSDATLLARGNHTGTQGATSLNTTVISGGKIITGLLTASNIQTGTLNASLVSVTNINATNITTGTITASNCIVTGNIQADQVVLARAGVKSSLQTITISSMTDITSLTVSITPYEAGDIILVSFSIQITGSPGDLVQVVDSVQGTIQQAITSVSGTNNFFNITCSYAASNTTARTIKMQGSANGSGNLQIRTSQNCVLTAMTFKR